MKKIILLIALSSCFFPAIYCQIGKLDSSFAGTGVAMIGIGPGYDVRSRATEVITNDDGSIYVLVQTYGVGSFIKKIKANGVVDSSYGNKGSSQQAVAGNLAVVQADGKILVAGKIGSSRQNYFLNIVRFNLNGTIDTSFSSSIELGRDFQATSMTLLSNGKIVVMYSFEKRREGFYPGILRLNADGSKEMDLQYTGSVSAVQANGDILSTTRWGTPLIRYKTNGKIDTISENVSFFPFLVTALTIQNDGKTVAAGTSDSTLSIGRFNEDFSIDSTFGTNGIETTKAEGAPNSIYINRDGKILVSMASFKNFEFYLR